jgi:anti-sigma B factor antagonist
VPRRRHPGMPPRSQTASDPSIAPFSLEEEPLDDQAGRVIVVRGELDLFTAPELRERLHEHVERRGEDLVVDLSGCAFVDASGCQALLSAARRLQARGAQLAIVSPEPANARVFTVMGLDELFPVVPSRAAATAALRRRAG